MAEQSEIAKLESQLNILIQERKKLTPGFKDPGGFADRHLLSGQLPFAGALLGGAAGAGLTGLPTFGAGSPLGGVVGGGAGAAGGKSIENALRSWIGLNAPTNLKQSFSSAGAAGLQGAAQEAGGQLLSKGLTSAVNAAAKAKPVQSLATRLSTSSIPQSASELSHAVKTGQKTLGEETAARGIYGTKRKVFDIAKDNLNTISSKLDELLSSANENVDPRTVVSELGKVKTKFSNTANGAALRQIERKEAEFVSRWLDKSPSGELTSKLSTSEANIVKRLFQNQAKYEATAFQTQAVQKEFSKAVARGLRKEIERIVPEASFLNKELHVYGQLFDTMADSIAKDISKGGISIANPVTTGAAGAGVGLAAGSIPAAAAAAGTVQLSRSFPIKTYLAAMLTKARGKQAERVAPQMLAHPQIREAFFKVLNRLSVKGGLDQINRKQEGER